MNMVIRIELKKDFEWEDIDINSTEHLTCVSDFISRHNSKKFYCHYDVNHLKWLLTLNKSYCICIKNKKRNNIVGIIAATVKKFQVHKYQKNIVEILFVYTHRHIKDENLDKKLREELERKIKEDHYEHIMWISDKKEESFGEYKSYKRGINFDNLISSKYLNMDKKINIEYLKDTHYLPNKCNIKMRLLEKEDLESIYYLYGRYCEKFNIYEILSYDEFVRRFDNKYIDVYVVVENSKIIDFISIVKMVLRKVGDKNRQITACKIYYYTVIEEILLKLIKNLLICVKEKYDIIMMDDVMENGSIVYDQNFIDSKIVKYYNKKNMNLLKLKKEQIGFISITN